MARNAYYNMNKSDLDGVYCCLDKFIIDDVAYMRADYINIQILGPHQVIVTGDTVEKAEWSLTDLNKAIKKGWIRDE